MLTEPHRPIRYLSIAIVLMLLFDNLSIFVINVSFLHINFFVLLFKVLILLGEKKDIIFFQLIVIFFLDKCVSRISALDHLKQASLIGQYISSTCLLNKYIFST